MHEYTVCVGWTVCVGPSVDGLFWAVTARQWRHTDPRQHNGSRHQSHDNIGWVYVRVCVCSGCIFISKLLLFALHYESVMNNVWHKSLMISFKHETRLWVLNVSSVFYHFTVLWCTGLHHKSTKSCTLPSTPADICDLSYKVEVMVAALLAQWLLAQTWEQFNFCFTP